MASSSLYRRLHGLFKGPGSAAIKSNKPNPLPPSAAAVPLTIEARLQKHVDKFIKNSESDDFRSRYSNYESAVRRFISHKQFSMVEDILEAQKKYKDIKDEWFASRLIMLYGRAGMFTHARKLFDELPELKCERTVESFNALLGACVSSKEYDQLEKIFSDLPREISIEANVKSYNLVIKAYCKMGALDKAMLFFNNMEKDGIEQNLIAFNTLITSYYRQGLFLEGENMWNMMERKNIAPSLISYTARLRGLVKEKKMEAAIGLISEMEERGGVKPNVSCFNSLIIGFCEDGNLEEAKKWYYKLKENEIIPNRMTYTKILPLLCEHGDFDMALELCKEATAADRLVIDVAEVQRVIDGLVEVSKIEEAKSFVKLCNSNNYLKLELPQTSTTKE